MMLGMLYPVLDPEPCLDKESISIMILYFYFSNYSSFTMNTVIYKKSSPPCFLTLVLNGTREGNLYETDAKLLSNPSFPIPHCRIRFPFVSETTLEYIRKSNILP